MRNYHSKHVENIWDYLEILGITIKMWNEPHQLERQAWFGYRIEVKWQQATGLGNQVEQTFSHDWEPQCKFYPRFEKECGAGMPKTRWNLSRQGELPCDQKRCLHIAAQNLALCLQWMQNAELYAEHYISSVPNQKFFHKFL